MHVGTLEITHFPTVISKKSAKNILTLSSKQSRKDEASMVISGLHDINFEFYKKNGVAFLERGSHHQSWVADFFFEIAVFVS